MSIFRELIILLLIVFKGTVTAGNAPKLADGASALLIVNEDTIKKFNLKPLAKIVGKKIKMMNIKFDLIYLKFLKDFVMLQQILLTFH